MNENQSVVNLEEIASGYVKDKYAMYLRKSRADLELEAMGEEETLARHKRMLENLAAKHGISMDQVTIYHEMVSGDSIDERPEMQRLLSDVYSREYKGVLVVEVERLARGNTKDQGEVADAFQYSDTEIITPTKVYDPNNEFDQEYFEFGLFMSRREYKTIKRRLESGKKSSVEEGNYIMPQRIFGYNIERRSKKERVLVPNPDEVPIVHQIFDWYTEEGRATAWIAKQLTLMGVPTVQKKPEWSRNTIRDMLTNLHYLGKVTWNEQRTVKELNQETGKLVKKSIKTGAMKVYEGKHDAIISVEQFEKAKDVLQSRYRAPVKLSTDTVNPFAGILKCKACGKYMEYRAYDKYGDYKRKARIQHGTSQVCKVKSMPFDEVCAAVIESLKMAIDDFEIKMKGESNKDALAKHGELIVALEAELKKQERRKNKLMDSWESEDGTYTRDEFIERKQMYNVTIDKLKEQIQEAKKNAPAPIDYAEKIKNAHAMIDCINDSEISAKAKNDFLKRYIDRIEYAAIDYGRRKGGKVVLNLFLK